MRYAQTEFTEARRLFERASRDLIQRFPAVAVTHVGLDKSDLWQPGIGTLATDGSSLFADPEFILNGMERGLTPEEHLNMLVLGLLHENGHVLFGHPWRLSLLLLHPRLRGESREEIVSIWREAVEHPLNGWMESNVGVLMMDWTLKDPKFVNLSAEEVFWTRWDERQAAKQQPKQPPQPGPGQPNPSGNPEDGNSGSSDKGKDPYPPGKKPCGAGDGKESKPGRHGHSCGGVMPAKNEKGDPMTEGEAKAKLKEVREKVLEAEVANRFGTENIGEVGAAFRRIADDLDEPVHPEQILEQHALQASQSEINMRWPHRFCSQDGAPFIPESNLPRIGHLAFLVDTSGSMNKKALSRAKACITEVIAKVKVGKITVVCCDTKVHLPVTEIDLDAGDEFEFEPKGGGGTLLQKAIDHVEDQLDEVDLIAFFSDLKVGEGDLSRAPTAPVVWFVPTGGRTTAPFGEIARLANF